MGKQVKLFLIAAVALIVIVFGLFAIQRHEVRVPQAKPVAIAQINSFSYKGENGKDALTILKEKTRVVQDKSGLVVSIEGRKADNSKHEYWEFFVNGKSADVGPAAYQTKGSDLIEWKISKY